jgi:hypothetical protein
LAPCQHFSFSITVIPALSSPVIPALPSPVIPAKAGIHDWHWFCGFEEERSSDLSLTLQQLAFADVGGGAFYVYWGVFAGPFYFYYSAVQVYSYGALGEALFYRCDCGGA